MNSFLQSSIRLIKRNGIGVNYFSISGLPGSYNVETGKTTTSEINYSVIVYPKQISATQYFYPNLIGKDSILFYLANDSLGFTPKIGDSIEYKNSKYRIVSMQETVAHNEIVLYRLAAVRG